MDRASRLPLKALAACAGLIAASAFGGAAGLIGGFLPLDHALVRRLPFHSVAVGGVALACVVGMPLAWVAFLAWHRDRRTGPAARWGGLCLVAWIAGEVAIIRQFSPLQPLFALAGAGLVVVGRSLSPLQAAVRPPAVADGQKAAWSLDLYWMPLGAGGHLVRWNGRVYEWLLAHRDHRCTRDLYHAALEVASGDCRYVVEMAPVWSESAPDRGVVREGAVGAPWLGRFRAFRYEVRCWRDGRIPDVGAAVGGAHRIGASPEQVRTLLGLVRRTPAFTWGRDALGCGEMWNSNSLISWLLARSGTDMRLVRVPDGGRAPGWASGLALAARQVTPEQCVPGGSPEAG